MQTKIKNPYEAPIDFEMSKYEPHILQHRLVAFNEGVKANSPRRFADQQPEEGQEVILFGEGRGPIIQVFLSWNVSEGTYNGYTHWLPYPTLD